VPAYCSERGLGAARGQRSRKGPSASYPARIVPSVEAVRMESGRATEWISDATGFILPEARPGCPSRLSSANKAPNLRRHAALEQRGKYCTCDDSRGQTVPLAANVNTAVDADANADDFADYDFV